MAGSRDTGTRDTGADPEAAGQAAGGNPGPSDDVKKKFREALERKSSHAGKDVSDRSGRSKVGHGHGPEKSSRMFRRKSGG